MIIICRLAGKRSHSVRAGNRGGTEKKTFDVLTPTLSAENDIFSMFHVAETILKERYLPDILCSQINVQIYRSFATRRFAGNKKARTRNLTSRQKVV